MPHAPPGLKACSRWALACAAAFAVAVAAEAPGPTAHAAPPTTPTAGSSPLAVLTTAPGDRSTELRLVEASASASSRAAGQLLALGPPVATLTHPPLATLRASVVADAVLVVVDEASRGDRSFQSALVRMRPGEPPSRLAGQVVHASRPMPRPASREVLVSRGEAASGGGGADGAGGARDDRLTIDAIDVDTGATRTVLRARGNLLFIAAVTEREVIAYRVDAAGAASLVAADLASGRSRSILADLPPFARDFSQDERGGALIFQNRHETDATRWVITAVDLRTGRASTLHEDASMQLSPHVWPDGSLALTRDPARPLERLDAGHGVRGPAPKGLPRGVARVGAVDAKGERVAVTSSEQGGLPVLSIVRPSSGESSRVAVPAGARATVAGFLRPKGVSR